MNYPNEIVSIVRKKTFAIEAHFVERTLEDDKPLEIFDDNFSRFVFKGFEDGNSVYANFCLDLLEELYQKTLFLYNKHLESKLVPAASSDRPAFTKRFLHGSLSGKSPADVLIENGDKGRDILNNEYSFLKSNLEKFPRNQELMAAISDAASLTPEELSVKSNNFSTSIMAIDHRPLIRKTKGDLCFCYEMNISWNSANSYPVCVSISNYYAPVEKRDDGTLNVILSKKDIKSEHGIQIYLSTGDWLEAVRKMISTRNAFEQIHYEKAFEIAEREAVKKREENKVVNEPA